MVLRAPGCRGSGPPEREDLADGHRHVGVLALGRYRQPPRVLALDDEADRHPELLPHPLVPGHAVALGEEERREAWQYIPRPFAAMNPFSRTCSST